MGHRGLGQPHLGFRQRPITAPCLASCHFSRRQRNQITTQPARTPVQISRSVPSRLSTATQRVKVSAQTVPSTTAKVKGRHNHQKIGDYIRK